MNEVDALRERMRLVPLGFWTDLCARIDLPHVPAVFSEPFPVSDLDDYIELKPTPALMRALDWAHDYLKAKLEADEHDRWMFRWECCSSSAVKSAAARGKAFSEAYFAMRVDDPRVFACTVGTETRVCVRPWVDAWRLGGYPVEFRAFVGPNGLLGISNYYPQRDMYDGAAIQNMLRYIEFAAGALCGAGSFPVGFTADFLSLPNGCVQLLEGGPPHAKGPVSAHPCCFAPGEIEGIALSKRPGALEC